MAFRKSLLKKLALSCASLCALFVIGELVTRGLEPGPFALFDSNPYQAVGDPPLYRHRAGFEGRWDGTWYSIDSRGLRGPELQPTFAPDELRVVAVGDSCTFGKGVVESESWPRQLETMLRDDLPERSVLVANLGHNGFSGAGYARIFREVGVPLKPQVVLVGYNLNDFPNAIRAVDVKVYKERGLRKLLSQDVRDFLGRFSLFRWARQTYYEFKRESDWRNAEAFAEGADDTPDDVWEQQKGFLRSIRDEAAQVGGHTAVFLFPYESQVYLEAYDDTPVRRLRAACEELELPFVDLAEEFRAFARETDPPRRLFLRGDRYHPDAQGYRIVASRVEEVLREKGWLP